MKGEIMEHIKNLKAQGINVKVDEYQINDLINKISDIKDKDKKNIYIGSEVDKFLKEYEYENISISYGKNKLSTGKINESLKKFHNKIIYFKEFINDYNEFKDNFKKFEDYKAQKEPGSVSPNQNKNEGICKKN